MTAAGREATANSDTGDVIEGTQVYAAGLRRREDNEPC